MVYGWLLSVMEVLSMVMDGYGWLLSWLWMVIRGLSRWLLSFVNGYGWCYGWLFHTDAQPLS